MSIVAMTGKDTITLNGRILNDFADGVVAELTFPNDSVNLKTGKNGNTIYALNNTGRQCEFNLRLLRGSADDKFLSALYLDQMGDFATFALMSGQIVKNIGDGNSNITLDTYILSGGAFKRGVDAMENSDGDTNQSVAVWHLLFSNAPRAIG